LLGALLAPPLCRLAPRHGHWPLALVPAATSGLLLWLLAVAEREGAVMAHLPWVPSLGLSLSLHADGLGLLYGLLIAGIGTLVVIYAGGYLAHEPHRGRFFTWLLLFMGAMLGVALADNLLLLFLFWELTTFSSFMLIGVHHEEAAAPAPPRHALLVTGAGGLVLLAGLLLLADATGSMRLSAIVAGGGISDHPRYPIILVLVLVGAASKSALFPFHSWLPRAMVAPTPVSAYLHAATMVKAGVYLLLRLHPVLGGAELWHWSVGGVGLITMLLGATLAPVQVDLKALLAYATVSVLGLLTLLAGIGGDHALKAALVFMLAHGFYKGALFFAAGSVDHATGTRDVRELVGLARLMPLTLLGTALAATSMAAIPPWFGFIAKEQALAVGLEQSRWLGAAVAWTGLCFVVAALVMAVSPFTGRRGLGDPQAHEVSPGMWLATLLLGAASLAFGLFPGLVAHPLLALAAHAVGHEGEFELKLWHGFTPAFWLSMASIVLGFALYGLRRFWLVGLRPLTPPVAGRVYEALLGGLYAVAGRQVNLLRRGHLAGYMTIALAVVIALQAWLLLDRLDWAWPVDPLTIRVQDVGVVLLVGGCLAAVVLLEDRLATIIALGTTGYSISLLYVLYGAPDLAMVQFLIESLIALLFAVAFHRLPSLPEPDSARRRGGHALLALAGGAVMSGLIWLALVVERGERVSDYFVQHAVEKAHAHNVVNAIVVEFRALDTLGEIAVLSMAALGGIVLIQEGRWHRQRGEVR